MKRIFLLFIAQLIAITGYGQLTLTNGASAATLVSNLVGPGVTASNAILTCSPSSAATFTCSGSCPLPFSSGIMLSSGNASGTTSPASYFASTSMGTPGDAQLTGIVSPQMSLDACVLEFDFQVPSDSIKFEYIFSSEEYNDYVNSSFNDVFAFFISGPGIAGVQNIAVVPNTAIPVAINSVNNGYSGTNATGPCTNCTYYQDNVGGTGFHMDGYTVGLVAKSKVQPCQTYHMKLAIADVSDRIFDSAVLLEENSFTAIGTISVTANGIVMPNNGLYTACPGSSVQLCLAQNPVYQWSTGDVTQCITVTQANINATGEYSAIYFGPGCVATSMVQVVFTNPVANITPSGPVDLCPGGTVTLTANAGVGYLWSTGATTQSITVGAAGTYTVTVSSAATNGPCTAVSAPVTVTVGSASANITGVLSLCNGASTTLTSNAAQSYLWSNGAITQSISVGAAGNYTVTVTQSGGCTASATVAVVVNANPTPAIAGITSICQGQSTTFDAGAGYTGYLWSNGATTQTISPAASGTYTVTVTAAGGCTGSTSSSLTVNPLPTPAIAGNLVFCSGGSSTLNAGAGYSNYLWTNGATTQTLPVSTAGNYAVTVTDVNGCSASTNVNVTVNANPIPAITGTFDFCQGSSTSLNATAGFTGYQWSNGAATATISVSTGSTFTVTVTDANGCTGTTSQATVVNPNPTPAISGITTICQGQSTSFNAGAGYSSYNWNTGAATASISPPASGTYTVTVTDANGCSGSTSATLTINPLPTPAIAGNLVFCSGGSSTLNAGAGYSNYLWTNGATTQTLPVSTAGNYAVTVTDVNGCSASTNVTVTVNANPIPAIAGTFDFCQGSSTSLNATAGFTGYQWSNGATTATINVSTGNTFTVTVTDANGCTGTTSQATVVNPNPIPAISGINTLCQGQSTTFDAGAGYSNYNWSNGATSATISPAASGTYTVTVTDANGCSGTTSQTLTVNPLPTPAIAGNLVFCSGGSSTLNAGAGYSNYLWTNGATTQTLPVSTAGNYAVTVTDVNGCSASTNVNVIVNANPIPAITGTFDFCQGSSTSLNATAGFTGYQWSNGAATATISVSTGSTFTVTVTDANGCTGTTSQATIINPNPVPAITGINVICQGQATTFDAGAGYSSYQWSSGAGSATISPATAGTYTVTVTDVNGCTGITSATLTVNPLPTPSISGTMIFCQGQSSNLNANAGYVSYVWNTGDITQQLPVSASGNYTVTVTDANGCSASTQATVTVNPLPSPVISGPVAICTGNSATLDAGAGYANYLWSNGAVTQTIATSTAGSYTVTVTSGAGCSSATSASLAVNPLPTPAIAGITSICQGQTTTFDAGAGYSGYLWSNGATTQTIAPGTAGSYTVTVTDINGCQNNTAIALTVNALPTPAITGVNAFCDGLSSVLDAGAGFANYLWSTGATTRTITVNTAGAYTVTVTAALTGCQNDDSENVTVYPNPVPVISGITAICQGAATTLDAGAGYATYQWSNGASGQTIPVSTAGNFAVTVTTGFGCSGSTSVSTVVNALPNPVITGIMAICQGQTTTFDAGAGYSGYLWSNGATTQTIAPGLAGAYTVTVTDANGCQNNTNIALTVNPLPTPTITGDFEFCQGDNSDLNAGAGYVAYVWSDGSTSQFINVNVAGTYSVTVTDNNGCTSSTSSLVIVNPLPVPVISGLNAICDGTTTTFDAGNYVSFVWSDGSTMQTINTGAAGTYAVTVTDINGCVGSTSQTLTVYDLPTAAITGDNTICAGQATVLNVAFTGDAPYSFTYTDAGGNSQSLTSANATTTITVSPGNSTTYTLLTVTDANCSGPVSGAAQIVVNPLPQPVITGDLSICDGEVSTLTATPGFVNYQWSNASTQNSITTGVGGNYVVVVTDLNGCVGASPAANLVVNMVPVISFTNDTSLSCTDTKVKFTNLSSFDPGSAFAWTFGDGGTSTQTNPSHAYPVSGTYSVSLTITTPAGCTNSMNKPVEILFYPLPVADFVTSPANQMTNIFNGKITFVDRSTNAVSWHWSFGDGALSGVQNPDHYYNEVGDFKVVLTVTNIAGCEDRHAEVIAINPHYVPNAFTPNGDGINDVFYYSGYDLDIASYRMNVFNRWGQLVFSGNDESKTWNGEDANGKPAPLGTYVYRLEVKTRGGKEHVFSGQVNLIR